MTQVGKEPLPALPPSARAIIWHPKQTPRILWPLAAAAASSVRNRAIQGSSLNESLALPVTTMPCMHEGHIQRVLYLLNTGYQPLFVISACMCQNIYWGV